MLNDRHRRLLHDLERELSVRTPLGAVSSGTSSYFVGTAPNSR